MERYLLQWKSNVLFWLFSLPSCHMSYFMSTRQLVTAAWRQFYPLESSGEGWCFLKLRSWVVDVPTVTLMRETKQLCVLRGVLWLQRHSETSGSNSDPKYCVLWTNYLSSSKLYFSSSYLSWSFCLYLWILKNG